MIDDTAFCVAPDCELAPNPDLPVALCTAHGWAVWAAMTEHAQEHAAAVVDFKEPPPKPAKEKRSRLTEPGWVYFVVIGGLVKIGWTANPYRRFRELRPTAVLHMQSGTVQDERKCHLAFRHLRQHGEYFTDSPEIRTFISDLKQAA